jgi:non-ribosomal peptide synthetase-like protein
VRYGVHYFIYRIVQRMSNAPIYCTIFGDSALIIHYLKWIGYDLNKVVQTGSNFGLEQRHDIPTLCDIGSGTMVSDGLVMINAPMSSSSFRVSKVKIGEHNYLGNKLYYRPMARPARTTCSGPRSASGRRPVRENVGLLGSGFEIPRAVERDQTSDHGCRCAMIASAPRLATTSARSSASW